MSGPRFSGVPGEARTVLYERDFGRNAVKVLPGEFFVSDEDIVITTVLGSCVAACIWDRHAGVGGMNHFMLPGGEGGSRDADPIGLAGRYGVFAMEQLINELIKRGGRKANFEAKVFGGGQVLRNMTSINIGERNAQFVEQFLRTEGIRIGARDLLDVHPRRVAFFPATGRALCKKLAQADASLVAAEQQYNAKLSAARVGGDVELF
ncbi:chemoreceptor glutamine deamidase CheD [Betaproteobacteria bacterium PRO7]|jgi:chemotaxis protein CheD|nr:chemoreceptor glutamine deamidase CheD [Betaproteobacteria bacterium PRO7]